MNLPLILIDRFPPSATRFLDLARTDVDDAMLWDIAKADYGFGADEAFEELRSIRDTGVIPIPMSGYLSEALTLIRWCCPERPNPPPFEPGPTGQRGHQIRLFSCAILFRAESDSRSDFHDSASDSTLANCLVSCRHLSHEHNEAIGCLLTWQFQSNDNRVLTALALLTVALRLRSNRLTEQDLNVIAIWVLSQDETRGRHNGDLNYGIGEPAPIAFSLQQGLWDSVALELEDMAAKIPDHETRENILLCAMLLDPA